MEQKIVLKRGNKTFLPVLSAGELACVLDTNELYVGDGTRNYNCSTSYSNLLLNNRFLLPITNDKEKEIIVANSKKYFMGNYYITNTAQVMIEKNYDGFISIQTTGAFTLEYREKTSVKNSTPFNLLPIIISFDVINNSSSPLTFSTGTPSILKETTINSGFSKVSVSFSMNYSSTKNSRFVILSSLLQTMDIKIGNIKIEQGSEKTEDGLYPLFLDSSCLEMTYKWINGFFRATKVTSNTIEFSIPIYVCQYFSEKATPTYNLQSILLYDKSGVSLNGFTTTVSLNNEFNFSFVIVCTKLNHGLSDGIIDLKLEYSIQ